MAWDFEDRGIIDICRNRAFCYIPLKISSGKVAIARQSIEFDLNRKSFFYILRASSGLRRVFINAEHKSIASDYFHLINYSEGALLSISDDLSKAYSLAWASNQGFDSLVIKADVLRSVYDLLQQDVLSFFCKAMLRSARNNLERVDQEKVIRRLRNLQELSFAVG